MKKKHDKDIIINTLTEKLNEINFIYFTDISCIDSKLTTELRRTCFKKNIKLMVVKNTLLKKAMELSIKDFSPMYSLLKGSTSLMLSENPKDPAFLIKDFRKRYEKPILKGAYVLDMHFIGDHELDALIAIKSKEEIIGDIIAALQSPSQNVISSLKASGEKISGILKTLSEK